MPIVEPAIGSTNWGPVINAALTQLDTIGASAGLVTQSASGAVTINAATGQIQLVTLTGNGTSSSISGPSNGQRLTIAIRQDATGSRTFVWPSNVKFAGGTSPTLTTTATKTDVFNFFYDGTNWIETGRALNI